MSKRNSLPKAPRPETPRREGAAPDISNSTVRLGDMLDSIVHGCQIIGFDWHYIYLNDAAARQGRTKKSALLNQSIFEKYPGIEKTAVFEAMQRCMTMRTAERMQNIFDFPNGDVGCFEVSIQPVPQGIMLLSNEITEQKKTNLALVESERRYRYLFENNPHPMWVYDQKSLAFLDVNESAIAKYGYSRQEFLRMTIAEIRPAEDLPRLKENLSQIRSPLQYSGEWRHLLKDGSTIDVEITSHEIVLEGRRAALVIAQDITTRKSMEKILRDSETRFRAMLENGLDSISLLDAQGRLVWESPALVRNLGYEEGAYLGRDLFELVHPDDLPGVLQKFNQLVQEPGSRARAEFRLRRLGGEWRWEEAIATNLLHDPSVSAIVINYHDITDRVLADQNLKQAHQFLQHVQDALSEHIAILDEQGTIIRVNKAWQQFGEANGLRSPEYGVGTNYLEICDSAAAQGVEEAAEAAASIREALAGHLHPDPVEYACHAPQERRWFQLSISGFVTEGQKFVVLSHQNITKRKQAEIAILQKSQDLEVINTINALKNQGGSLKDLFTLINHEFQALFSANGASIYLYDGKNNTFFLPLFSVPEALTVISKKWINFNLDTLIIPVQPGGVFEMLAQSNNGSLIDNPETIQQWMGEFASSKNIPTAVAKAWPKLGETVYRLAGIRSVIVVPLRAEGQLVGLLDVSSAKQLNEQDLQRLRDIGGQITSLILHKQQEEHLWEANQRFEQLVSNIEEGFWIVASESQQETYFSPSMERIWGVPLEDLRNKEFLLRYIIEADLPHVREMLKKQERGEKIDIEYRIRRPDGQIRWLWDRSFPVRDDSGKLISNAGLTTDITAEKNAQLELEFLNRTLEARVAEQAAEVQDLYEHAPVGYHSLDENGYYLMVNQTELDWLGYTREELIGKKRILDLLSPDTRNIFFEHYPTLKKTGFIRGLEYVMVRRDGTLLPVLLNATVAYDENGNFSHTRSTIFDITERKSIETALKQSEETYRALFETAQDAIFLLDPEGYYVRVNPRAPELLGFENMEEIIGRNAQEFIDPTQQPDADDKLKKLLAGERIPVYERRFIRQDGVKIDAEINLSLLRDTEGKPKYIQSVVRDIGARKQVERRLQESRDRLSAANAALEKAARIKDEFLASMSHELRTPLTGVLGLSEALQLKAYGDLTERQLTIVKTIEESGRHLLALINDILDLSKIQAGKLDLNFEQCDLTEICDASIRLVKGMVEQKRHTLHYTPPAQNISLRADKLRLKQVLVNLMSNATKFTPEGGEVGLEVEVNLSDRRLRLTVWDTGIGIKPEDMPQLFQPFQQIDSSLAREYSGTGLGLSLVRQLVEMHNGGIEVQSEFGKGSRFSVVLPWSPNDTIPLLSVAKQDNPFVRLAREEHEPDLSAPLILLGDDSELALGLLGDFLESRNYRIIKARNSAEVLTSLMEYHPDVLLLDVQMPGVDGLETLRILRSHPESHLAQTPVIMVTAMAMSGDRERCLAAGANEYVSKPVYLKQLAKLIQKYTGDTHTKQLTGETRDD